MGLRLTLARACVQVCVYWGNPQNDGYGGQTFDSAVEIKCRWEESSKAITDNDGVVIGSTAGVFVLQDMDEQGYVYQGFLADLTQSQLTDPKSVDGAWEIKQFEKIPILGSTTEFVRKIYLTTWTKR